MKTYYECIPCLLQSIIRLFKNGLVKAETKEIIIKKVLADLSKESLNQSPPSIAQKIHKIVKDNTGNEDPYKEVKYKYNKLCLEIYERLKNEVMNNNNPTYKALKLSVIGNIIDFGPNDSFNLLETISKLESIDFAIDDSRNLFNDIKNAHCILFLGDNAGETVFDRVLGTRLGIKAAEMIHKGEFGKMAALKGTDIISVPLEKAVGKLKTVPKERYGEAKLFFENEWGE